MQAPACRDSQLWLLPRRRLEEKLCRAQWRGSGQIHIWSASIATAACRIAARLPLFQESHHSTSLLHGHINEILILQPQLLRGVIRSNAFAIHHEADLRGLETEATATCVHQLPQGRA